MRHARVIRLLRGLSLRQVETATGIERGHLSRFERGTDLLSNPKLKALAEYYGVSIDTLIALEEVTR